jgi:hypothetical protein
LLRGRSFAFDANLAGSLEGLEGLSGSQLVLVGDEKLFKERTAL